MQAVTLDDIRDIIGNVIGNPDRASQLGEDSPLLDNIPELDSMAIVHLLLGLEQRFGFYVDDDEVDVDIFKTAGSLCAFVQRKIESKLANVSNAPFS